MKLLILTQVVDSQDPSLSFFVRWLDSFSSRFTSIHVICLKEGEHALPENVHVHSLGKETGAHRLAYMFRFYRYAWKLRHEYDAVFVHMNQEYILLGGPLWMLMRKPVYLWRNHYAGSLLTDIAALFCTSVFCTSKHSYTAKYRKTTLMPVGIDLERFDIPVGSLEHEPRSILFFARMAPSKRPEMLIDALGSVLARGISFTASFYGSPLPHDTSYYESLKARAESQGLHDRVRFFPGIPNDAAASVYRAHDIFVNCSRSGMFDKTLFEAAACGCRVIAASDDFHDAAGDESYAPDTNILVERIISALAADEDAVARARIQMQALALGESLGTLGDRLVDELQSSYS